MPLVICTAPSKRHWMQWNRMGRDGTYLRGCGGPLSLLIPADLVAWRAASSAKRGTDGRLQVWGAACALAYFPALLVRP